MFSGGIEVEERHQMNLRALFQNFVIVKIVMIYLTQKYAFFKQYIM